MMSERLMITGNASTADPVQSGFMVRQDWLLREAGRMSSASIYFQVIVWIISRAVRNGRAAFCRRMQLRLHERVSSSEQVRILSKCDTNYCQNNCEWWMAIFRRTLSIAEVSECNCASRLNIWCTKTRVLYIQHWMINALIYAGLHHVCSTVANMAGDNLFISKRIWRFTFEL